MIRTAPFAALLLLALALRPESAAACAVCFGGEEESRNAFILTTVLLSVLPPGMVGGLVWWIWRRTRAQREAASESLPNAG